MLVAHKIIDALNGVSTKLHLRHSPNAKEIDRISIVEQITASVKFDFGRLPLLAKGDGKFGNIQLLDEEILWWADGFIPLPYPLSWFEWNIGEARQCALIKENADSWSMSFFGHDDLGRWLWNGVSMVVRKEQSTFFEDSNCLDWGKDQRLNKLKFQAIGDTTFLAQHKDTLPQRLSGTFNLCMYLTLALSSKSTDRVVEAAPTKLNVKREQSGKSPLFNHTIVDIAPQRYISSSENGSQGHRSSPRMHRRRSHLRHLDHEVSGARQIMSGENIGK
jgi:hypothetical protein